MSDDATRAIEENLAEFLLAMGRAGGREAHEERTEGGVHWTLGGSPIAYHNAVVRADLAPQHADAAIEASIERLRALGVPGSWHVGPSMRPGDLVERLQAHGFAPPDAEPGMAADLERLPAAPAPEGFRIEVVRDATGLRAFRDVLAAGFGEGPPEADWVTETYARIGLDEAGGWLHLLGRVNDAPASTVSVHFTAGVAGLYFVCTAPDHRRQGIGAATTLEAMRAASERGYQRAVLTSSPMGHRVYERLGFRTHCRIDVLEYDPAADAGLGAAAG